jgi:hypothetical protein
VLRLRALLPAFLQRFECGLGAHAPLDEIAGRRPSHCGRCPPGSAGRRLRRRRPHCAAWQRCAPS